MNPQVFLVQSTFSHGFPMVFPVFPWFSHGFPTVNERPAPPSSTPRWSWDRHGNRSAGSPVAAGFPWDFTMRHGETLGKQ